MKLEIKAAAKVNLTLDVKYKRPDGYHEIETVMMQLDLFDHLYLEKTEAGIEVTASHPDLPPGADNIAYRAAELLMKQCRIPNGVRIHIEKNIPLAAGLAGGSTDAAAVLLGLNRLLALGLSPGELRGLGEILGSDVPFCIMGGVVFARGRGEILSPLPARPEIHMVLVKPDFQVSTAEVYRALNVDRVKSRPDNPSFIAAWNNYDIINIAKSMGNILESVTLTWHPEIETIKQNLLDLGALNAIMSGSGPTVMGLFTTPQEARAAAGVMQKTYREVYALQSWYDHSG